jgi:trehalose 6-phosphate phosphatase
MTAPLPLWNSLPLIERQWRGAEPRLVCADFDGTLAPIVPHPEMSRLPEAAASALTRLAALANVTVAIVSGRSLEDLRRHVPLPGLTLAGNHGLEIEHKGAAFSPPGTAGLRAFFDDLSRLLASELESCPGVWIENKGLTVTVHTRAASAPVKLEAARAAERFAESRRGQVRLTRGFEILELRPPLDWHKGSAIHWLRERTAASAVCYLGDDTTDEDAFASLPSAVTVKVGSPESTHARYWIPGPAEAVRFLDWLSTAHNGKRGAA